MKSGGKWGAILCRGRDEWLNKEKVLSDREHFYDGWGVWGDLFFHYMHHAIDHT